MQATQCIGLYSIVV